MKEISITILPDKNVLTSVVSVSIAAIFRLFYQVIILQLVPRMGRFLPHAVVVRRVSSVCSLHCTALSVVTQSTLKASHHVAASL